MSDDQPIVVSKYKLEITKNTKGFNYVVSVRSDNIEELKEDTQTIQEWAEEQYGAK